MNSADCFATLDVSREAPCERCFDGCEECGGYPLVDEFEVEIRGRFRGGSIGTRGGTLDRFAEPDDPDEIEDVEASRDGDGWGFELTDEELDEAIEKLFQAHDL